MIKGVGVKGVGLAHDLLPSLLERLGREEAEASAGKKARNGICGALAIPPRSFASFSLQNLRKIPLLTCLAGQGRLCWCQDLRSLSASLARVHVKSVLLRVSYGSVTKKTSFMEGRTR